MGLILLNRLLNKSKACPPFKGRNYKSVNENVARLLWLGISPSVKLAVINTFSLGFAVSPAW